VIVELRTGCTRSCSLINKLFHGRILRSSNNFRLDHLLSSSNHITYIMPNLDRSNNNGTLIEQGSQSFASLMDSLNGSCVDIPAAPCYSARMESRKSSPRYSPSVSQLLRKKRSSPNSSKDRKSAIFSSLDNAQLNLDDGHNEKNHDNSSTGELCKSKEGSESLHPFKPKNNLMRSKSKKGMKTPMKSPEKSLKEMLQDLPDESNAEVFLDFGQGMEGTKELNDSIGFPTTPKQRQRRKSKKVDKTPVRSKSLQDCSSTAELFGLTPSPHSQKRNVPRGRKSSPSLHRMASMLRGAAIEDTMSVYSEGALPLDRASRRSSLLARGMQALEDLYEDCA
jgi:hypothetical protein